jgi:adenosylcobinamide-GDP ribazoletransferase
MKEEIRIFFTALMFYTRIPCPKWVDHHPDYINKATRYFPLIGWITGLSMFATYMIAQYALNPAAAVIFILITAILITGAFHEDGFADTCDGFGGGWTKEKILEIMKDSRIGTYGVVGLCCLLSVKAVLLFQLACEFSPIHFALYLIITQSLSRWVAATFIHTHQYVSEFDTSKVKPVAKVSSNLNLYIGIVWVIIPLGLFVFLTNNWLLALLPITCLIAKYFLGKYFTKWIGGYTGDCLGATQQVCEVVCYVSTVVLWKFI